MKSDKTRYEELKRSTVSDLRRRYDEVYQMSIEGETQSERDWWSAYSEALEEAIADISMGVLQLPLTIQELAGSAVAWLEDIDKEEVVPALIFDVTSTCVLFGTKKRFVTAQRSDYGIRWRAWAFEPRSEEREAKWRVSDAQNT